MAKDPFWERKEDLERPNQHLSEVKVRAYVCSGVLGVSSYSLQKTLFRKYHCLIENDLRDVLPRVVGLGRDALLQSPSSATVELGGGMSPFPLMLPNLLPGVLSVLSSDGLNLLPFVHESSRSAAPAEISEPKPGPLRLTEPEGVSGSPAGRGRRLARQSVFPSDTLFIESKRLRGPSREGASGSGPSRRHGFSNLPSSAPGPKPGRSLAVECNQNMK
jgi:hypothetical protein